MKIIHSVIPTPFCEFNFPQGQENIAFFDIETTGLSPKASSIYLIGAMSFDAAKKQWMLTQWFANDYKSEAAILTAFLDYLANVSFLYHFNGAGFDIPYIRNKCEKYNIIPSRHVDSLFDVESGQSIDLFKKCRPLKKRLGLRHMNQTALERYLGLFREDKYDGGKLIDVYSHYMQQKFIHPEEAPALEQLLLLHNHDDIGGMLTVSSMLSYLEVFFPAKPFEITQYQVVEDTLFLHFPLTEPVPKECSLRFPLPQSKSLGTLPSLKLSLIGSQGQLAVPLYSGILKYFFTNYKEYYYLPDEDMAIHKSVAEFVDSAHRKKATAATCYTKKEGIFFPGIPCKKEEVPPCSHCFYAQHKDKLVFYELDTSSDQTSLLKNYLFTTLSQLTL